MEDREIEKNYSLTEFVAELRRLADTLEAEGTFAIEIEGEEVTIPEGAIASIVYEVEGGHAEIEFQMSWETGEAEGDTDEEAEAVDGDEPEGEAAEGEEAVKNESEVAA